MLRSFRQFLTENTERVDQNTFDLRGLFRTLNRQLCDGEIPESVPVVFGRTRKGAAAETRCQARRVTRNGRVIEQENDISTLKIIISSDVRWTLEQLKGVLAHEMVHALINVKQIYERSSHGTWFMAYRARFERRAGFTIPLEHADEDDVYAAPAEPKPPAAPKRVAFLLAQDRKGEYIYRLYSANVTGNDVLEANKIMDKYINIFNYPFAMFGIATTSLVDRVSVSRKVDQRSAGVYSLPKEKLSLLKPEKIISHLGGPLPSFS